MAPNPSTPPDPPPQSGGGSRSSRVTRRTALAGAALVGLGAGVDRAVSSSRSSGAAAGAIAFHGPHQGGILTPPQGQLAFAAFDLTTSSRGELRALMADWTAAAAALTAGQPAPHGPAASPGPSDPGETGGLAAARLTLTFGFGPGLFAREGLGLRARAPQRLRPLPPFAGEQLDPARSGGDLCIQACADDPQVAFHAVHTLARLAGERARVRWTQLGFRPLAAVTSRQTPRNLLGFKDGTNNLRSDDGAAMRRYVWAAPGDGPAWLTGGTYLIVRRIELVLSGWDETPLAEQERAVGRHKASGAPLGARDEFDPVDLRAVDAHGMPVIPADAHIRLADAATNNGAAILRRGYSFSDPAGADARTSGGAELIAGLFFIAFARDPGQFITLQRRLATGDALSAFTLHTGSAIFACPPGVAPGGTLGAGLLA